jgi:CRISPR/Cas system-associated exonuclease Cas4 (RecB family)
MEQKLKDINEYIENAIQNIQDDRAITSNLLTDVITEIKKARASSYDSHKELGQIAAKYVETLQRSNEQLVKIATLLQKKESRVSVAELSGEDKSELFDLIQESK